METSVFPSPSKSNGALTLGKGVGDGLGVGVAVGVGVGVGVGVPQGLKGEWLLRGFGMSTVKSFALSFVSMQPLPFRNAALVTLKPVTGPLPKKQLVVPKPTKSNKPVAVS